MMFSQNASSKRDKNTQKTSLIEYDNRKVKKKKKTQYA